MSLFSLVLPLSWKYSMVSAPPSSQLINSSILSLFPKFPPKQHYVAASSVCPFPLFNRSFRLISTTPTSTFPDFLFLATNITNSFTSSPTVIYMYSSGTINNGNRRPSTTLFAFSSSSSSSSSSSDEYGQTTDSEDDDDDAHDAHAFPRHLAFPPQHHHHFTPPPPMPLPDRLDVLGLGQAMVDFSGVVDDIFLEKVGLEKGTRKVVNHEERGRVLQAMDGRSYKAAAGGSLSNTLVALARLGGQPIGGPALNIAMAGSVGTDPLGGFYRSKLKRANVNFLSTPVKGGTTGTVIVLTTPDAQRTMLAYQGTSSTISYDSCLAASICKTNVLVIEGYLFELPDTIKTITRACEDARSCGALIAVTASDVSCIERHYDDFWDIMANYADIVFANSDEARAFCHFSYKETPVSAARYLSHFVPLVSVTDGARGSYIGVKGEAVYIPPPPCVPVDTCGAGDAYASGILYGVLRGASDLRGMGGLAAKVASIVVGQQGTRLRVQDAVAVAKSFTFCTQGSSSSASSSIRSDVGSDQISSL